MEIHSSATFGLSKSPHQIYYNIGYSHDANTFNLTGENHTRENSVSVFTSIKSLFFTLMYRIYLVIWFSIYFILATSASLFLTMFSLAKKSVRFNNDTPSTKMKIK